MKAYDSVPISNSNLQEIVNIFGSYPGNAEITKPLSEIDRNVMESKSDNSRVPVELWDIRMISVLRTRKI